MKDNLDKRIRRCMWNGQVVNSIREYIRETEKFHNLPTLDIDNMTENELTFYVAQLDEIWDCFV